MKENKVSYNFGAKGWGLICYEIVLLFFMTGLTVDGLNIIVPQMGSIPWMERRYNTFYFYTGRYHCTVSGTVLG